MPVRQRSPTNNATTTLPEDPMAFQTIRGRNPDGSTTVYHVHESVLHGGGGNGMSYAGSYSDNNMMYGAQSAYGTPYAGHQYQQHQPYIVYAQRASKDDSDDESSSDDEETSSTIVPSTTQKRSLFRKCNRTSIPCVLLGIVMAISFIVGYVFMVESIVNHSRKPPAATSSTQQHGMSIERSSGNGSNSGSSSENNGNPQQPLMEVAQLLNLEPQYFVVNKVLQPVNAAEVPPSSLSMQSSQSLGVGVGQPRSMSTATTTTATRTRDVVNGGVAEQQQLRGVVQQSRNSIGIPNGEKEDGAASEQQSQSFVMSDVSRTVDLEYPIGGDGPV